MLHQQIKWQQNLKTVRNNTHGTNFEVFQENIFQEKHLGFLSKLLEDNNSELPNLYMFSKRWKPADMKYSRLL